ncbi:MAG: hypothetical protein LBU32_02835 [Clostridiales bacterium]|jgi:hypothetical protein|nr:hypothetical protein [Clostridiales bacterium]
MMGIITKDEWDNAAFTAAFNGEKIKNGQHMADIACSLGHIVRKTTEKSETKDALLNGQSINITLEIPGNKGDSE